MTYREIKPPSELRDVVRYFWILEHDDQSQLPLRYKLFAESCPGLIFFYHSNYSMIAGQTYHHKEFMMPSRFGMIGAFLFPYSLPLLFGLPANELTNSSVELETLLGIEGCDVKEKITEATNHRDRVDIISAFLFSKLKKQLTDDRGLQRCVRHIVQQQGNVPLDIISRNMGISHRQMERKFQLAVGMSPKLFSRLIRFSSTLRTFQDQSVMSLTDLSYRCGYFDQSHFIRDFKFFSGLSPKQYFKLKNTDVADNFIRISNNNSSMKF